MATEESEGPRTRLEEQATAKADLSYSYFLKNNTGTSAAPPPRLLSEEEVKAQLEAERQKSAQAASLWNHAGTFEERTVTPWAKEKLTTMLKALSANGVSVTGVNSINGDANIWVVRGKTRYGFAFEITLAWTAQVSGGVEVKGTLTIPNADVDDMDDLTLKPEVLNSQASLAAAEREAVAAVHKLKEPIEQVLQQFYEEFKQRS